jgi:hypothetical protein
MTTHAYRLLAAWVFLLVAGASAVTAQPVPNGRFDVPPVPPNLAVPAGHVPFLKGYALGTQNYICLPASEGPAWTFVGPQATLFQTTPNGLYQQITTHFLAPNPFEAGLGRPSWQHSFDSSQVWGRAIASSLDPMYVEPGAIAWLLVQIVGAERGPAGGAFLAQTTYIQRLNTSGGAAPSTPCQVGQLVMVPYSTDYFFYRAETTR